MEWEKISKKYAEEYYDEMFEDKEIPLIDYENKYQDLRILIKKAYKESLIDIGVNEENLMQYKNIYKFDCIFGIRLYHIFSVCPPKKPGRFSGRGKFTSRAPCFFLHGPIQ